MTGLWSFFFKVLTCRFLRLFARFATETENFETRKTPDPL
ncbi:hypothetical protein HMPREF0541_01555 [Lacticaseibacillus rhamnosus ATCC 21052]|nr:hypothetical protein HMPREF0541_01555 [Lacticaseibacillus rhamnosus ATCC 21052]